MVQELTTIPSASARFGQGFSEGLYQQIPKEVEYQRLSAGLQRLAKDSANLSPLEFQARASSIYGMTPEMTRQFGELVRQQNLRNSFKNQKPVAGATAQNNQEAKKSAKDEITGRHKFRPVEDRPQEKQPEFKEYLSQGHPSYDAKAAETPGLLDNPTKEKYIPYVRKTPQQRISSIQNRLDNNEWMSIDQATQMEDKEEEIRSQIPKEEREQQEYLSDVNVKAREEFNKRIAKALQKEGPEIFKDLTGEFQQRLEDNMIEELKDSDKSPEEVANKWANIGLAYAKNKTSLKTMSNGRSIFDTFRTEIAKDTQQKLKSAQKAFSDMGSSEELFNILQQKEDGFGLSPGRAAQVAYKRSDSINNIVKEYRPINSKDLLESKRGGPKGVSRDFGEKILKNLTVNDSLLAIAEDAQEKDPYFNKRSFFSYMDSNRDKLTPTQRDELLKWNSDILPTWGDIAIFPITGGSYKND